MWRLPLALVLVLAPCACGGTGVQGLGGIVDGLALVVIVSTLVVLALFLAAWMGVLHSFRGTLRPGSNRAAVQRAWRWALGATIFHAGIIALYSEHSFGAGEAARVLMFASVVPIGALGFVSTLAARAGFRWPAVVTLTLGLPWVVFMVEAWQGRSLFELPGRVVQFRSAANYSCARLSTGQVACLGANWKGERGDGSQSSSHAPTLVRGIDDATELAITHNLGCVVRRDHGAACWGSGQDLPVPGSRLVPWALPGGEAAVRLVVSEQEIVVLDRDGALHGWPKPPPASLARAQTLFGDAGFGSAWFCVVDLAGALACWDPHRSEEPVRFEVPPVVALAVEAPAAVACAADNTGTVRCFDLIRREPARTVEAPGLRQLVALAGGAFCVLQAGGRVTCWHAQEPAREQAELAGVERIFAGGGLLCGERGNERRCLSPRGKPEEYVVGLLGRDRSP